MLETRRSVSSPPRSRRKFGSSFIVETIVRLAPVRGASLGIRTSRGVPLARDAVPAEVARAVRLPVLRAEAVERPDWVLTCADLPVAEWAESDSRVSVTQWDQPSQSAEPAVASVL